MRLLLGIFKIKEINMSTILKRILYIIIYIYAVVAYYNEILDAYINTSGIYTQTTLMIGWTLLMLVPIAYTYIMYELKENK
jgi:hypothetical protein